jgi:uncharacterized protein YigE (DUF2233 family)
MRRALATFLLVASSLASADQFTVVPVDTRKEHLELFLRDESGKPFRRFDELNAWLISQNKRLRFAMNAGMFESDLSPVGLFVTHGKEIKPLNLAQGRGNFFMKPNGVFLIAGDRPKIVRSSTYSRFAASVELATQSGPLLLERGVISPAFSVTSQSKFIRNGVGVRGGEVFFVISNVPVTFYEFATYFKDQLHCPDALYFDGSVSGLFYPKMGRNDATVDLGPIIAIVE